MLWADFRALTRHHTTCVRPVSRMDVLDDHSLTLGCHCGWCCRDALAIRRVLVGALPRTCSRSLSNCQRMPNVTPGRKSRAEQDWPGPAVRGYHGVYHRQVQTAPEIHEFLYLLMSDASRTTARTAPSPASTCAVWLIGTLSAFLGVQMVLESPVLSGAFLGRATWESRVRFLGGEFLREGGDITGATLPMLSIAAPIVGAMLCLWLMGAGLIAWRSGHSFRSALSRWGTAGWIWWWLPGLWSLGWLIAAVSDWTGGLFLLAGTVDLWWAVALAGSMTTGLTLAAGPIGERPDIAVMPSAAHSRWTRATLALLATMLVYVVVFTTMNWQLWRRPVDSARRLGHVRGAPVESAARQRLSQLPRPGPVPRRASTGHSSGTHSGVRRLAVASAAGTGGVGRPGIHSPAGVLDRATSHRQRTCRPLAGGGDAAVLPAAVPGHRDRLQDLSADRLRSAAADVRPRPTRAPAVGLDEPAAAGSPLRQGGLCDRDCSAGSVDVADQLARITLQRSLGRSCRSPADADRGGPCSSRHCLSGTGGQGSHPLVPRRRYGALRPILQPVR